MDAVRGCRVVEGIEALAYAKINLSLEVTGKRDDGYHEIKTVLHTIDLADRLAFRPAEQTSLECDQPSLEDEHNLVLRTCQLIQEYTGHQGGAAIRLQKNIPVAAGLGGGSSDAASVLAGLSRLWELGLSDPELEEIAAELGSDVPFFIRGGTALAQGRGEALTALPSLESLGLLLVCPRESILDKTRAMYQRISRSHYTDGGITQRVVDNLVGGTLEVDGLHNVFETVALETFPGLRDVFQQVGQATGQRPRLSGAGPALFCLPAGEQHLADAARVLGNHRADVHLVRAIMPRLSGEGASGA